MLSSFLNSTTCQGLTFKQIRSDNEKPATGTALVAVGDKFESTIAAVMYHARSLVMTAETPAAQSTTEATEGNDIRPQWYENWYDGLGYCEYKAALSLMDSR